MSLIELKNVQKDFYLDGVKITALKNISFKVDAGEFLAIVGPSGSGKTTLLHIIGCLSSPTKGKYFLDNVDVSCMKDSELAQVRNKKVGFVFQSFNLLSKTKALHNVALPLAYGNVAYQEREQKALTVLDDVGLSLRINHFPTQLSGGEQQRVAIARALVTDPAILLADEPTGNLDSKTGDQIMEILREMNRKGKTVIVVTHNESVAKQTNRMIHLKDAEVEV
ncbi:ABC transporter ATP-binding protein [Candidatus Auribacterota bacterium]